MAQHVPEDAVVPQLAEELHDGVGRRRAAAIGEAPQNQHLLALIVEVRAIAPGGEHPFGDALDFLETGVGCQRRVSALVTRVFVTCKAPFKPAIFQPCPSTK